MDMRMSPAPGRPKPMSAPGSAMVMSGVWLTTRATAGKPESVQ